MPPAATAVIASWVRPTSDMLFRNDEWPRKDRDIQYSHELSGGCGR